MRQHSALGPGFISLLPSCTPYLKCFSYLKCFFKNVTPKCLVVYVCKLCSLCVLARKKKGALHDILNDQTRATNSCRQNSHTGDVSCQLLLSVGASQAELACPAWNGLLQGQNWWWAARGQHCFHPTLATFMKCCLCPRSDFPQMVLRKLFLGDAYYLDSSAF